MENNRALEFEQRSFLGVAGLLTCGMILSGVVLGACGDSGGEEGVFELTLSGELNEQWSHRNPDGVAVYVSKSSTLECAINLNGTRDNGVSFSVALSYPAANCMDDRTYNVADMDAEPEMGEVQVIVATTGSDALMLMYYGNSGTMRITSRSGDKIAGVLEIGSIGGSLSSPGPLMLSGTFEAISPPGTAFLSY